MTIDRGELVCSLGYKNECDMYKDLYTHQHLSLAKIDKRLGVSTTTVCLDLKRLKIKRRPRGGFNHSVEKSVLDKMSCIPLKVIQDSTILQLIEIMGLSKHQHYTLIKKYLKREFGIVKVPQGKRDRPLLASGRAKPFVFYEKTCIKSPFRSTRGGVLCTVCERKCRQVEGKPV